MARCHARCHAIAGLFLVYGPLPEETLFESAFFSLQKLARVLIKYGVMPAPRNGAGNCGQQLTCQAALEASDARDTGTRRSASDGTGMYRIDPVRSVPLRQPAHGPRSRCHRRLVGPQTSRGSSAPISIGQPAVLISASFAIRHRSLLRISDLGPGVVTKCGIGQRTPCRPNSTFHGDVSALHAVERRPSPTESGFEDELRQSDKMRVVGQAGRRDRARVQLDPHAMRLSRSLIGSLGPRRPQNWGSPIEIRKAANKAAGSLPAVDVAAEFRFSSPGHQSQTRSSPIFAHARPDFGKTRRFGDRDGLFLTRSMPTRDK